MNKIDLEKVPRFAELPIKPDKPKESSWGVFGDDDELGCLNFLSADGVVEAARLVRKGLVFRLDTKINYAKPPLFARQPAKHNIMSFERFGLLGFDDSLDSYNTQEGSQWDGLGHVGHVRHERFYSNVTIDEVRGGNNKLGIHHWANKFVGRGLLLDVFGYRKAKGIPVNALEREVYTLAELKAALEHQGSALKPGTVLLVRTGWMESYEKLAAEDKRSIAPMDKMRSAGIEASREIVAWMWNNRVAAIGTDCPSVEAFPSDFTDEGILHYRALPLLGLPLGELFVLAPLAEDCARDRRYEFMLVSTPLNVEGGIASPPNAVAIK